MIVRASKDFEIDDSDGKDLFDCLSAAERELTRLLDSYCLDVDDFEFNEVEQSAVNVPYKPEVSLAAVIHQYPEGDYSAWELPTLSDEDARAIDEILDKYSDKGCSVRSIDYDALFQ